MFLWQAPVEIVHHLADATVKTATHKYSAAYAKLVLTDTDRENIAWIVTTLGENGKLALGLKFRSRLEERGEMVGHVHPIKFFAAIFDPAKPYLKEMMAEIESDRIKWNAFMEKFRISLSRYSSEGTLAALISDFSYDVGHPEATLRPYFEANDWDGLVRHLTFN